MFRFETGSAIYQTGHEKVSMFRIGTESAMYQTSHEKVFIIRIETDAAKRAYTNSNSDDSDNGGAKSQSR